MKLFLGLLMLFSSPAIAEVCRITTQRDAGATTTSTLILSERRARRCLLFQNQAASGGSTVYIKFDTAHSGTEHYALAGASSWEPRIVPVNKVYVKSSGGDVLLTVIEGQ